jgi:hypothetical protein
MSGPEYPSLDPEIAALLRERKKIEAVKVVRAKTGLRMKEAKERIDAFEAQMGLTPEPVNTKASLIFWVVMVVVGLAIYFISTWQSSR